MKRLTLLAAAVLLLAGCDNGYQTPTWQNTDPTKGRVCIDPPSPLTRDEQFSGCNAAVVCLGGSLYNLQWVTGDYYRTISTNPFDSRCRVTK